MNEADLKLMNDYQSISINTGHNQTKGATQKKGKNKKKDKNEPPKWKAEFGKIRQEKVKNKKPIIDTETSSSADSRLFSDKVMDHKNLSFGINQTLQKSISKTKQTSHSPNIKTRPI